MTIREALELAAEHAAYERWGEAETLYRQVLAVSSQNGRALAGLGQIALRTAHIAAAIELLERAAAARPPAAEDPDIRATLAEALHQGGRFQEADVIFDQLLAQDAHCFPALWHRGNALYLAHRFEEAEALLSRAADVKPDCFSVQYTLGAVRCVLSRPLDAVAALAQAVAIRPDHAAAHIALGQAYLLAGDFPRGFEQMEWRWQHEGRQYPPFPQPRWDGRIEPGKLLFLVAEQGLGDTIQCAGFLPPLLAAGMRVAMDAPAPLVKLLRSSLGGVQILEPGDRLGSIDYHLPMMSLGLALGITPQDMRRATTPYLVAAPRDISVWKQRLGEGAFHVGIAWAGRAANAGDVIRSMPLSALAPLAAVPGVRLHSLHNTPAAREAIATADFPVTDHAEQHSLDFPQTAALMTTLDVIVSVDTSLVHLAGALGRPVWVMLAQPPDPRWMLHTRDTPWYPSATLFRQSRVGDWEGVIREVHEAVRQRVGPI